MIIKRKGNDNIDLNDITEYREYIKTIINNIKNYDSIKYSQEIDKYFYDNISLYKKDFDKKISSYFYKVTILNKQYWLDRGWTDINEINEIIIKEQSNRGKKFAEKNKYFKENFYEEWCKKRNTHISFYKNLGYSDEVSKQMLKERQNTFTLEKCIEKYGKELGKCVYDERQINWVNKMKTIDFTPGCGIPFLKNKYGENWINIAVEQYSYLEDVKNNIKYIIKNELSLKDLCIFVEKINITKSLTEILPYFKSKIIQEIYFKTFNELKIEYLKVNKLLRTSYSIVRWYNNHIVRSNGEFIISKFLVKNDIDYIYEKNYNPTKMKCDFYLSKLDLYIEYTGMLNKNGIHNKNTHIIKAYEKRLNEKIEHCKINNLKLYYNEDIKVLILKIKELYEIK